MKAPDKVYVKKERDNVTFSLSVQYDNGGDVFIRKDALLEWLKNKIKEGYEANLMTNQIANLAYKDVIDKLNSL